MTRRRRRALPLLLALLPSLLLLTSPAVAAAPTTPAVVVEIDAQADSALKVRLTRRLIALELNDVEVPPAPGLEQKRESRTLFVRVLGIEEGRLRVELWEHGEFHGARRVTAKPGTSQRLRARRVALAAAELARRLRRRRLAEARRLAAEKAREAQQEAAQPPSETPRIAVDALARGAAVGPGDFWVLGPGLAGQLRFGSGARLRLGMAWLSGGVTAFPYSSGAGVRWFELAVTPAYALQVGSALELEVGASVAAAAVHLTEVSGVDDIPGQLDTWSARAAAGLRLTGYLSRSVGLYASPEVGAVLRRVPVHDERGESHRLGGVWLGATLGVVLDPNAPTRTQPVEGRAEPSPGSRTVPRLESVRVSPAPSGGNRAP